MSVPYTPVLHDDHRTMEQQTYLLAKSAKRAWQLWSNLPLDHPFREMGSEWQIIFACLARDMSETDIFMAGVHHKDRP